MDPTVLATLITVVLGSGGILGGVGWIFSNLLKNKDDQITEWRERFKEKVVECEQERQRADEAEQKYVNVLIADIDERKERDRTLDLITQVAARGKAE